MPVLLRFSKFTKRTLFINLILLIFQISIKGQVNTYSFTTSTGATMNSMAGSTQLLGSSQDDISSSVFSIGFTFNFGCTDYTQFSASSNGLMGLGSSIVNSSYSNSTGGSSTYPVIMPFWDDMHTCTTGKVHYVLSGSSPNRVLTVEWLFGVYSDNSSAYNKQVQVRLYETTNVVEIVYGSGSGTAPGGGSIGIASSGTSYHSVTASANTSSTVTANDGNTTFPASGRKYTFTPGAGPSAPGCASGFSPVSGTTGISRCSPTLTWTAPASSGCNSAASYDIYFGTSSTPSYFGTATTNSFDLGVLTSSTVYYWKVVPTNSSGSATGCTTQSFTTNSSTCTVSPAGISSSLVFWVKANSIALAPTNNSTFATWDDKSGGSRNAAQATNGNKPTYKDNATDNINYNPIVNFDGTDDYMDITTNGVLSTGNNSYAVYAVIAPDNTNTDADPGKFFFSGDAGANNFCSFDTRGPGKINDSWNQNDLITSSQWNNSENLLATFNYNGSSRNMYKNGSLIGTMSTSTNRTSTNTNSALGLQSAANIEFYGGKIAEIISYKDKSHSSSSRETVESYLAIKYGITLPHNYYASNGTNIFTVASTYTRNVIGIGSDNANAALLQKQSHNSDDTVRIYKGTLASTNNASTATFTADISYVVMGANSGKLCNTVTSDVEVPSACGLYSRLEREWKVTNTNFGETFNIDLKLNSCAIPSSVTVSNLRLLVDDDGDFSTGTTSCFYNGDGTGVTITYSNPLITITGLSTSHIPNNSTRYITVGSVNQNTPLPITLTSFDATCNEKGILIKWNTATELNNDHFELERSADGINFTTIATINGHGTTQTQNAYSFQDKPELKQQYYYRLKQIDYDLRFRYYNLLSTASNICDDKTFEVTVFPNPANESLIIKTNSDKTAMIEIINNCGQIIYSNESYFKDNEGEKINTEHLANGIYVVKVVSDYKTVIKKVTINH